MKKGEKKSRAMFSKMFIEKESQHPPGSEKELPQQDACGESVPSRGRADAETLARRKIVRAKRSQKAPDNPEDTTASSEPVIFEQNPTEV
mmetsp:Transcript_65796/g.103527  ORF Transcript_65796/g.103527 Transcript_65796/m.103527 type:complete len:90 (+) Transcript_65796:3-272(+)